MSSKDKNSIFILIFIISLIISFVFFVKTTRFLPLMVIGTFVLIFQYVCLVPDICKKYYAVYDNEASILRWIPIINEIQLMPSKLAIASIAFLVAAGCSIIISVTPITLTSKFLDLTTAMDLPYKAIVFTFLMICVFQILAGVNYIIIFSDINSKVAKTLGGGYNKQVSLLYILCLIPFVRVESLNFIKNRLDFLMKYSDTEEENCYYEMEENGKNG